MTALQMLQKELISSPLLALRANGGKVTMSVLHNVVHTINTVSAEVRNYHSYCYMHRGYLIPADFESTRHGGIGSRTKSTATKKSYNHI